MTTKPKPARGWAIVTPKGRIMVETTHRSKGWAQEIAVATIIDGAWRVLRAEGYRAVRVTVNVEER